MIKVLHLVGSADSEFYFDLSYFYASGCEKPLNYEFYYTVVHVGGLWSFPSKLSYEDRLGDSTERVTIDKAIAKILEIKPDAVVHHMLCTKGFTEYRGLVEVLGFPLVGSSTESANMAQNKVITRALCRQYGVRVAEGCIVSQDDDVDTWVQKIPFPCVVKAARTEDSQCVILVKKREELDEALKKAYEFGRVAVVERFIQGREIRVSVLRDSCGRLVLLPPWEYTDVAPNAIRTFSQKLEVSENGRLIGKSSHPVFIETEQESELVKKLEEISFRAFNALELNDFAVIDYRVDENGLPWLLELNMVCSFGPKSVIPIMAKQAGIHLHDLFHLMVTRAIERHKTKSNKGTKTVYK